MNRIPRPKGLTELNRQVQLGNKSKQDFINLILNHYFQNQNHLNNEAVTIEQLSEYTKTSKILITKKYLALAKQVSSWLKPERLESLISQAKFSALKFALEDRLQAQSQVVQLQAAQGAGYRAFITSEVTKAMSLSVASTQSFLNVVKSLEPPQKASNRYPKSDTKSDAISSNPSVIGSEGPNKDVGYLTIDAAYEILNAEKPRPELSAHSPLLDLQAIPEVIAGPTGDVPTPALVVQKEASKAPAQ